MKMENISPASYTGPTVRHAPAAKPEEKTPVNPEPSVKDRVKISSDKEKSESGFSIKKGFKKIGEGISNWVEDNITGSYATPEGKKSLFKVVGDYRGDHKRMAAAAACAGGAVGTGVGLWTGLQEVKTDKVELAWSSKDIRDPKLTGYSHWAHEVGHTERDYAGTDSEGRAVYTERYVVDGYWHRYSPDIRYDKVGTYNTPGYDHTNKWTPITAGFAGLVSGTLLGGALGFVVSVANKLVRNRMEMKKPSPDGQ